MSKRYTYEEVKYFVENLGYKLISDKYENNEQRLILKDNDGYYYTHSLKELKRYNCIKLVNTRNPYSLQNIKLWLKLNKNNLILLSKEYINSNYPLVLKDNEGYYYSMSWDCLQRGNKPRKFIKSNPYTIQNIKLWLKLNNKQFELVSDSYEYALDDLIWKCSKEECGEKFKMSWGTVSAGHGCSCCDGRQVGLSNCLATKNPELASEWHPTKNCNLTPYDVTCSSNKYIWWQCKENPKHEWYVSINTRNRHNSGCPYCSCSKGEKKISNYLDDKKTFYIYQKEFEGLIGLRNGLLSYDFYLPQYNLLIEFQGEQHEKYISWFHNSYKDFEKQLEHDKRKCEYAQRHNIKLLEIWYYDFDKIEEILQKELNLSEVMPTDCKENLKEAI